VVELDVVVTVFVVTVAVDKAVFNELVVVVVTVSAVVNDVLAAETDVEVVVFDVVAIVGVTAVVVMVVNDAAVLQALDWDAHVDNTQEHKQPEPTQIAVLLA